MPRQVLFSNHDGLYEGQCVTPTCPRTPDRKDTGDKVDPLCWLQGAFASLIPYSRGVLWFILLSVINLNLFLFLPHPPFLSCTSAPSFVPVFLSPAAAVDVLKHEVIFSVVRLAATCIICLGFLLLLLPEEWDSVTLRFLANIADKKSEEHGEELTESSVNTRSRSRANGAVSIPLAWHGRSLLVAFVNQSWSCVCSCSPTAHPGGVAGCSVHMDSLIRKAGSIFMNFKWEMLQSLHHFTAGGGTENIYGSYKIERVESVIYFLEVLATLSPCSCTPPNQELCVLPWPALWTVFCEYKYWQGEFGSILYVFMIFI